MSGTARTDDDSGVASLVGGRSGSRSAAVGLGVLVLTLALFASGVVVALGDRFSWRVDVTRTGEQALSPRTEAVLEQASALGGVEIVVAVDASAVEPWSRQTVRDVLDLFGRASHVRAEEIDVGTARGQASYAALLARLVERERGGIDQHRETIERGAGVAGETAQALRDRLAPALSALAGRVEGDDANARAAREGLSQWSTLVRVGAGRLEEAAQEAVRGLSPSGSAPAIPPLDRLGSALRGALSQRGGELEGLESDLGKVAALPGLGEASPLASRVRSWRDALAREVEALERLPKLDVVRIADALDASEVALVIGPPGAGIAGIDVRTLYEPTVVASEGDRTLGDVRLRAEELLASAVASVGVAARPIVVFTHGESRPILEDIGFLEGVRRRLDRRGIDLVEWAAAVDSEPPDLDELDPDLTRPVVYMTLSPDSSASKRGEGDLSGPERAQALGRAVSTLLARREAVLVSLNPSVLPGFGEADPVAAPLAELGIEAATHAPLLRRSADARAAGVQTEFTVRPSRGAHPVLRATGNLPTALSWPIALRVAEGAAVRATGLVELADDPGVWGETQWLRLWQTPGEQRRLLPDQPQYDEGADEAGGPWMLALAAERANAPEGARTGRVVVVGSNGWYADPLAFRYESGEGRVGLRWPGNAELFESAVLWLAGQDELIAASAEARAQARIRALEPGTVSAIRWLLVGGLPLCALGFGVVWRLIRG